MLGTSLGNTNFIGKRFNATGFPLISCIHCVKSVRNWSYSGLHFPALGLNTTQWLLLPSAFLIVITLYSYIVIKEFLFSIIYKQKYISAKFIPGFWLTSDSIHVIFTIFSELTKADTFATKLFWILPFTVLLRGFSIL